MPCWAIVSYFQTCRSLGQYFGEAGWNVDERIAIRVARFDQRDRRIGVFGEITRNDAAGRARANNDNVVGFLGH